MKKVKAKKYWVMLARPVIQTTIVEVNAISDEEAEIKARKSAAKLPHSEWDGYFQTGDYGLDVVACISNDEIELDEDPEEVLYRIGTDYHYMLLKADMETGQGTLIVEPWLGKCNPITVADFLSDWKEAAQELYEDRVGKMYDWFDEQIEENAKQKAVQAPKAKVIILRPHLEKIPKKNSDNDN